MELSTVLNFSAANCCPSFRATAFWSPAAVRVDWIAKISMKNRPFVIACVALFCTVLAGQGAAQNAAPSSTTAIKDGRFHVDVRGVIGRSDVVLGRPNLLSEEAMPLGNGRLGVAVWSADGLTAQLNRDDTMPSRLSTGQVVIPGIAVLTNAKNYTGRLDLFNGEFREQGGGMGVTAYVEPDTDTLIVDVTGANPNQTQTALLKLWAPREPQTAAHGKVGLLFHSWLDNKFPESSGRPFGSLSAITAEGRDVTAEVTDPLTITVSFTPFADGHFRIIAASPHYDGTSDAQTMAGPSLAAAPPNAHQSWWSAFWNRAGVLKITSKDGSGEYMENLRNIYLFVAAIEKGVEFPGTQAGVGDMISSARDEHRWDPSAFWHWNLRMQVAANLGAGLPDLNEPYFHLYRGNLTNIETWTKSHMKGLPGSCVPETMRFNGKGIEYESTWNSFSIGLNCDAAFKPYYNARTLSTGAEVSLWVWRQYLATNDRAFLAENYPLMASSARFLLAYQKIGPDGLLHTSPTNAHEQQWDVTDSATDISAIRALYSATIEAAKLLDVDPDLVNKLQAALPRIPPFPRTQPSAPHTLLDASADAEGADVLAESYRPEMEEHNVENIGLEPVWPYDLIGDSSPLLPLAQRTFAHRPSKEVVDWSYDPIHAARLGLAGEVRITLTEITQKFQRFVNGMAKWEDADKEFYVEQSGVVAAALQEALVQDYDGLIRVAPAIPPGWDFDGSIHVRGKTRVDVQTRDGAVIAVLIEAGSTQLFKLHNPWSDKAADVISEETGTKIVQGVMGTVIEFAGTAGTNYLVVRHDDPVSTRRFTPVDGVPASAPRKLGNVQIGLFGERK
jgi:alpha-L-fucosidase 2